MKEILTTALVLTSVAVSFFPNTADATVILDTDFSNTTLYPPNVILGTVNDGLGAWNPFYSLARAVDLGGGTRAINTYNTGNSYYTFNNIYTEGQITVEFSVIPHDASGNWEIILGNGTATANIGPQIRLTDNNVTYYTGSTFVTIPGATFAANEVNTFSFTAYLSGANAGTFDLYANNVLVGENLDWRNDLTSFTNLRFRSTTTTASSDLTSISITHTIPEPSTAILGLTALLLIGGLSRNYRRKN